ncbi:MAG: hypothetical protein JRI25_30010 [Deltaproteobacteria bacterium]|nr:hypothetical protein [Deltaproteobacteria bacterium]
MEPGDHPDDTGMESPERKLMQTETTSTLFDLAITAEKLAAHFYDELAALFPLHPEIHAFWKGMQSDEETHARMLGDLRSVLLSSDLERAAEPSMVWNARNVLEFAQHERVGEVQTLADAYQLAHEFEHSEINTVFAFLMQSYVSNANKRRFLDATFAEHGGRQGADEGDRHSPKRISHQPSWRIGAFGSKDRRRVPG